MQSHLWFSCVWTDGNHCFTWSLFCEEDHRTTDFNTFNDKKHQTWTSTNSSPREPFRNIATDLSFEDMNESQSISVDVRITKKGNVFTFFNVLSTGGGEGESKSTLGHELLTSPLQTINCRPKPGSWTVNLPLIPPWAKN